MPVVVHTPTATLNGMDLIGAELGEAGVEGWRWRAELPGLYPPDSADDTPFVLMLKDRGFPIFSPPLVALSRSTTESQQGKRSELAGMDLAMWKLGRDDLNLPSFRNTTTTAIVAAVSAATGVEFVGTPHWEVGEEEIKASKGSDPILRIAAAAAMTIRTLPNGKVVFQPVGANAGGYDLPASSITQRVDSTRKITGMTLQKTSRLSGAFEVSFNEAGNKTWQFTTPMANAFPIDLSTSGVVKFIGLWNGDPGAGGVLVQAYPLNGFQAGQEIAVGTGVPPITHGSVVIEAGTNPGGLVSDVIAVRLRFQGQPWNGGASSTAIGDPEFRTTVGDQSRPAKQAWTEPLWRDKAQVDAIKGDFLVQANKGYDTLSWSCPLWLPVSMGELIVRGGYPDSVIEAYSHKVAVGAVSTTEIQSYRKAA